MTQSSPQNPKDPKSSSARSGSEDSTSSGELLRHLLIGSAKGVNSTIRALYSLGYAEVGDWSPLLPAPNSGDVMSILTKTIFLDKEE